MGWKASMIIINPQAEVGLETLLHELGFKKLKKIDGEPLDTAIYPDKNKVYVGFYKDSLLICASDLPMEFFNENISETEQMFLNRFPYSEVCSLILHSTAF